MHIFCRKVLISFLGLVFLASSNLSSAQETSRLGITIVMPDDFPPYVSKPNESEGEGERIDMWNLWSRTTGIPITILRRPWPQVLLTLETKEADVADMVGVTQDRLAWLQYGSSYGRPEVALFTAKEVSGIRDIASARGTTVGVVAKSICETNLAKDGVETRAFASTHDLFQAAIASNLPVFCYQTTPGVYLLAQAGIEDSYRHTDPIFANPLHWTVRKGETALFDRIDEGFRLLAPSEVAAITSRWSGQTVPVLGGLNTDQVIRLLAMLSTIVVAAMLFVLALCWRLSRTVAARAKVEACLRDRVRQQSCLHEVFLATDNMQRPMAEILADLARALRVGRSDDDQPLVRIELMGHVHDEIGTRDSAGALTTPILIEGKERGRITLLAAPDQPDANGDRLLLGLAASRIAGRTLGETTLAMLKKSDERFRRTFLHSAQATAIIRDGRFVSANGAALDLLGYKDGHSFLGLTPAQISPSFQPDGEPSVQKSTRLLEDLLRKGSLRFEWEHLRRDGESVLIEVLLTGVVEDHRTDIFVLWNDITVKRQAEAALAAYQQTLEAQVAKRTQQLTNLYDELHAIFGTATAGIALVRDGSIVTCNPSLATILLWPHAELIGRSTRAFFMDEAAWKESRQESAEILSQGGIYEKDTEVVRLDGSTIWVRMRATSVDVNDTAKGTVWVVEDTSKEHAAKVQLAEAHDLAVQAARLKSEFLAHISHELRSPINAVIGFTEFLTETDLSQAQRDFVHKVQTSGQHLLMVLNDVLDLSKVEAGKLRIEETEFALSTVLRNSVDTIAKGVAEKDLELLVEVDAAVPRRLASDQLRISQILMNFLTNAVKFTQTGTIRLAVTCEPPLASDAADICRLRFSVSDTGVGMSPEQVDRMFQRFSQAEDSTARLYGGSGLGLSICRQLATLMNGEVGVTSIQASGSTFWATLPLRSLETASALEPEQRLSNRRILLVDDHAGLRNQLSEALERNGAAVTCALSGTDAIAALTCGQQDRPHALVIDMTMPGMDGIETIRHLRETLGTSLPPVILMTKQGGQTAVDTTLAEGIEDLVIKPVDTELLVEKLVQLLDPDTKPLIRGRSGTHVATPNALGQTLHAAGKRALVIDDNPLNRELTTALLSKYGIEVETAENGADGLERLLDRDFDVVFMDNQMPVMGGLETTRRIRALPTAKGRIPVIGLTGRAAEQDLSDGIDAGMNDYIIKPVAPASLRAVLSRWLAIEIVETID